MIESIIYLVCKQQPEVFVWKKKDDLKMLILKD
jgi:hypothetical protein